jgi:hypothetical protein
MQKSSRTALAVLGFVILVAASPGHGQNPTVQGAHDVKLIFGSDGSLRSVPASPCAGVGGLQTSQPAPARRMSWWPDRCSECSLSPECIGLLDGTACHPADGARAICRSTGELCSDEIDEEGRYEVSCYCDVIA